MKHGDGILREGSLSDSAPYYIAELQFLAAQVNARRPPKLPQPERISLITWLLWDCVILAYGVAALVLLRVLP